MSKQFDKSHGSPFDRGGADFWYHRPRSPHKYPNGSYNPPLVTELTPEELEAYEAGYAEAEANGDQKNYE